MSSIRVGWGSLGAAVMSAAVLGAPLGAGAQPASRPPEPVGPPMREVKPQASGLSIVVIRDKRRESWRRVAVLNEIWFYCSPRSRALYAVPPGYVTDFASIPGFAKLLFPPFGDWAEAAVIHDWLYDIGARDGKEEADRIFGEAMTEMGVRQPRRSIMLLAVKLGGGSAYRAAEQRIPQDWESHFVDRYGASTKPPFPQPSDAVWKRDFDCGKIETQEGVWALQEEYLREHPGADW